MSSRARLRTLAIAVALFSVATVGAAAFLPLERFGQGGPLKLPVGQNLQPDRAV
jgi:hypothetical protein